MKTRVITTVREMTWTRYAKYRCEIGFLDGKDQVMWLSEKQATKLNDCMDECGGNSSSRAQVVAVVEDDERGQRFVWCCVHGPKRSGFGWLAEKFGVELPTYMFQPKQARPILQSKQVPQHIEDELQD